MKEKCISDFWLEHLDAIIYYIDRNKKNGTEAESVGDTRFSFGCDHFEVSLL